jgi:hypothetical protein
MSCSSLKENNSSPQLIPSITASEFIQSKSIKLFLFAAIHTKSCPEGHAKYS